MAKRRRDDAGETTHVVSTSLPEAVGRRVLDAVNEGVERRWEPARRRAGEIEGADVDERVAIATSRFRREIGAAGAASGGAAAVPGVGTAISVSTVAVEVGWTTIRLTDLILTIAALHGHRSATVEERRLWVLSVMTYGGSAATMVSRLSTELGLGFSGAALGAAPAESLRQLNRALGTRLLARFGSRGGAVMVAMTRLLPFGVGAVLGYGLNSFTAKTTARNAHEYFSKLPPRADDVIEARTQDR